MSDRPPPPDHVEAWLETLAPADRDAALAAWERTLEGAGWPLIVATRAYRAGVREALRRCWKRDT